LLRRQPDAVMPILTLARGRRNWSFVLRGGPLVFGRAAPRGPITFVDVRWTSGRSASASARWGRDWRAAGLAGQRSRVEAGPRILSVGLLQRHFGTPRSRHTREVVGRSGAEEDRKLAVPRDQSGRFSRRTRCSNRRTVRPCCQEENGGFRARRRLMSANSMAPMSDLTRLPGAHTPRLRLDGRFAAIDRIRAGRIRRAACQRELPPGKHESGQMSPSLLTRQGEHRQASHPATAGESWIARRAHSLSCLVSGVSQPQ